MATLDYIVSYYFWSTIIVSLQIMLHFVLLNTLYVPESLANQLSVSAFQRAWAKCAFMTTVVSHHWSVFWSCSQRQSMNLLFHQHLSTVWWIILLATAGLLHRFILHCRYDHPYLKPGRWSGYFYLINFPGPNEALFLMYRYINKLKNIVRYVLRYDLHL